jgi:hypothetical protein
MGDKEVHFVTGKGANAKTAMLYNVQGRNVLNIQAAAKGCFTINRENLKPGVWIVRVGEQALKFLVK